MCLEGSPLCSGISAGREGDIAVAQHVEGSTRACSSGALGSKRRGRKTKREAEMDE